MEKILLLDSLIRERHTSALRLRLKMRKSTSKPQGIIFDIFSTTKCRKTQKGTIRAFKGFFSSSKQMKKFEYCSKQITQFQN